MKLKAFVPALLTSLVLSALAPLAVFAMLPVESVGAVDYLLVFVVFLIATLLTSLASGVWSELLATRRAPRSSLGVQFSADIGKQEMGTVKWFDANKGYGFILRDTGPEIFVHYRSILGEGHRVLHEGQRVKFVIAQGRKGLQAEKVDVITT
ncbi:MAG: cold shock domain-containing protein [Gammaproteobacteria bacterium]|nr:cold shock domain-containing protein [Gammaproteobacteria bacterium]